MICDHPKDFCFASEKNSDCRKSHKTNKEIFARFFKSTVA